MMRLILTSFVWTLFTLLPMGGVALPLWTAVKPQALPALQWEDKNGIVETPQTYHGQVVILNLWATWCTPCLQEMPTLDKLQRRYQRAGLSVVPVAVDDNEFSDMSQWYRRLRVAHLPLRKAQSMIDMAYMTKDGQLPASLILNQDGQVIGKLSGAANWFSEPMQAAIEALLRGNYTEEMVAPENIENLEIIERTEQPDLYRRTIREQFGGK